MGKHPLIVRFGVVSHIEMKQTKLCFVIKGASATIMIIHKVFADKISLHKSLGLPFSMFMIFLVLTPLFKAPKHNIPKWHWHKYLADNYLA